MNSIGKQIDRYKKNSFACAIRPCRFFFTLEKYLFFRKTNVFFLLITFFFRKRTSWFLTKRWESLQVEIPFIIITDKFKNMFIFWSDKKLFLFSALFWHFVLAIQGTYIRLQTKCSVKQTRHLNRIFNSVTVTTNHYVCKYVRE